MRLARAARYECKWKTVVSKQTNKKAPLDMEICTSAAVRKGALWTLLAFNHYKLLLRVLSDFLSFVLDLI